MMTNGNHSSLPLAMSAMTLAVLCAGNTSLAQEPSELDLTISVIEEGETPEGFVNRLELPALDAVIDANTATEVEADLITDTVTETTTIADDASQVVTDTVREVISVDGTVAGAAGGGGNDGVDDVVEALPPAIVDILDPNLPLEDTLTDTLDGIDGVVDTLPDVDLPDVDLPDVDLPGALPDVGGVLNSVVIDDALTDTVTDNVDTATDIIVDNLDATLDSTAGDAVNDIISDVGTVPLDGVQDLPVSESPLGDVLAPVTDEMPELPEIPGL